jgi:CDGSH-type Zn-finger protein
MEQKKENKPQAVIELLDSGALKITGNFKLKDMKRDTEISPVEALLCLCGRSCNKPYCDDSHKK